MTTILTNNTNAKDVILRGVGPWAGNKTQPAIAVPFIGTTPDTTFLFRFQGQSEETRILFWIFDNGVTVSSSESIVTVKEQIIYIRDTIFTDEPETDWTLFDDRYYAVGSGVDGIMTQFSHNENAGGPGLVRGTIIFKRGRIGDLS